MGEIIVDKDGKITDWGDQKPKSCGNCEHDIGSSLFCVNCKSNGKTTTYTNWELKTTLKKG